MIAKRKRWIIAILLSAVAIFGYFLLFPNNHARAKAERFRRTLQKQGFKTELSQFDFRTAPDVRDRAAKVLAAGHQTRDVLPFRSQAFSRPVGTNAAAILSAQDALMTDFAANDWATLRRGLDAHQDALDDACAAILAGPVRFDPNIDGPPELSIQYVGTVRAFAGALAARTLCELHEHHELETWTNLLALTRLATAWDTEPWEFAHLTKFNIAVSAAHVTWDAQRRHALNHAQIAMLDREWRKMKIFEGLPIAAELSCAMTVQACEFQRTQPPNATVPARRAIGDFFDSPSRGWAEMTSGWRQSRYRNFGSYEDEYAAMRFYSNRQRGLREAIHKKTWAEIREIPSITNNPVFQGVTISMAGRRGTGRGGGQGFLGRQRSLVLRAAETEARRTLVLAALALEMFYQDHKEYPTSLEQLNGPGAVPVDFMDGKPLRYRRISPQDFVLYSTGPDCVDDGGITFWDGPANGFGGRGFFRSEEPDMLWPRVASTEEILAQAGESSRESRRIR